MTVLSDPTQGLLCTLAVQTHSTPELHTLLLECDLLDYQSQLKAMSSKADIIGSAVRSANRSAKGGDTRAEEALFRLAEVVAAKAAPKQPGEPGPGTPFWKLREALRADGLELRADFQQLPAEEWEEPRHRLAGVRLLPIGEPDAPIIHAVTAVEDALTRNGMAVALNHYQQGLFCLREHKGEAANGALRSTFEAVIVHLAQTHGFTAHKAGEGGNALAYLIDKGLLSKEEDGAYLRGLWKMTHTNGPHPGTTTAGEGQFRLHALTSAIGYLLDKLGI